MIGYAGQMFEKTKERVAVASDAASNLAKSTQSVVFVAVVALVVAVMSMLTVVAWIHEARHVEI
jgi:CHASE3 domain sensor protein